jgi:hypothetical protein
LRSITRNRNSKSAYAAASKQSSDDELLLHVMLPLDRSVANVRCGRRSIDSPVMLLLRVLVAVLEGGGSGSASLTLELLGDPRFSIGFK